MPAASIVLLLAATLACPWSLHLSLWPPDSREADLSEQETAEMAFRRLQLLEEECHRVITADAIVVGEVLAEEPYRSEQGPILTAFTVEVERVLKGTVGSDHIVTSIMGGTLDGRTTVLPGVDFPVVGERYVFCLTKDSCWRPGSYRGGSGTARYHIVDGEVVSKGMPLEEFAERIKQQLHVLDPIEQMTVADASVVAIVEEVVNNAIPAPVSLDAARLAPNHAILAVKGSLSGDISDGTSIRVELPPWLHSGHTIEPLKTGGWVLAFLRRGNGESWCLLDGASSVRRLEADSAETALSSARSLVAGDGSSE